MGGQPDEAGKEDHSRSEAGLPDVWRGVFVGGAARVGRTRFVLFVSIGRHEVSITCNHKVPANPCSAIEALVRELLEPDCEV